MSIISAKLNQNEINYLEQIAADNHLYKGESKELSVGKAMKELIKWCQMNDVKIGKKQSDGSTVNGCLKARKYGADICLKIIHKYIYA